MSFQPPNGRPPQASGGAAGAAPWIAAALALAGAGLAFWRIGVSGGPQAAPPVHEAATDWRDPLMPTAALLARRGPRALPIEAAPALPEGPREGFLGRPVAEVNRVTCAGARTLVLPDAAHAFDHTRGALEAAGDRLVTADPAAGVLEAEIPGSLGLGVQADVLARIRTLPGGAAAVDLRAINRHGATDGGANCRRILSLRAAIAR